MIRLAHSTVKRETFNREIENCSSRCLEFLENEWSAAGCRRAHVHQKFSEHPPQIAEPLSTTIFCSDSATDRTPRAFNWTSSGPQSIL